MTISQTAASPPSRLRTGPPLRNGRGHLVITTRRRRFPRASCHVWSTGSARGDGTSLGEESVTGCSPCGGVTCASTGDAVLASGAFVFFFAQAEIGVASSMAAALDRDGVRRRFRWCRECRRIGSGASLGTDIDPGRRVTCRFVHRAVAHWGIHGPGRAFAICRAKRDRVRHRSIRRNRDGPGHTAKELHSKYKETARLARPLRDALSESIWPSLDSG